jgi:hypothetical protein
MVPKPRSKPRFSPQRTLDDPALECLEISSSALVSDRSGTLSFPRREDDRVGGASIPHRGIMSAEAGKRNMK